MNRPPNRLLRIAFSALFGAAAGWFVGLILFVERSPILEGTGKTFIVYWGIMMLIGGIVGSLIASRSLRR